MNVAVVGCYGRRTDAHSGVVAVAGSACAGDANIAGACDLKRSTYRCGIRSEIGVDVDAVMVVATARPTCTGDIDISRSVGGY